MARRLKMYAGGGYFQVVIGKSDEKILQALFADARKSHRSVSCMMRKAVSWHYKLDTDSIATALRARKKRAGDGYSALIRDALWYRYR